MSKAKKKSVMCQFHTPSGESCTRKAMIYGLCTHHYKQLYCFEDNHKPVKRAKTINNFYLNI